MNVKLHHTTEQLLKLYRKEPNHRFTRRIHGVYLASNGLTCPEVMKITGAARRAFVVAIGRIDVMRIMMICVGRR